MASVKQLEKMLSSVKNEKRLYKETNEELMRKYIAQNKVVRKRVWKLVKSVFNRFVVMAKYIGRAISKLLLKDI